MPRHLTLPADVASVDFPEIGITVSAGRRPDDTETHGTAARQPYVIVDTDGAPATDITPAGEPVLSISLNDADLYDVEHTGPATHTSPFHRARPAAVSVMIDPRLVGEPLDTHPLLRLSEWPRNLAPAGALFAYFDTGVMHGPGAPCDCDHDTYPGTFYPCASDGDDSAPWCERHDECARYPDDIAAAEAVARAKNGVVVLARVHGRRRRWQPAVYPWPA